MRLTLPNCSEYDVQSHGTIQKRNRRLVINIRDLKHRQRNARRRLSQPKEDWVEGFVLGGKKES